jgi:hypothetical protein
MTQDWVNKFIASFSAPLPDTKLIRQVRQQMHELLEEEMQRRHARRWMIGFITLATLATVPCFLLLNYLYYLALHGLLAVFFPPLVVQSFVITFIMLATLIGALGYGSIPLCTFYLLRHFTGDYHANA